MTIKIGLIGMSKGNGHPYSWGAICNGYDPEAMKDCGFPVIPEYLGNQPWPASKIPGVKVTGVWTQDIKLSKKIARATKIDRVCRDLEELNSLVDVVLLARDDAQNHLRHSEIFLASNKPIYFDKPIALSIETLEKIYELQKYEGQIFTCSALRYSDELQLSEDDRRRIGPIKSIVAKTPKIWSTYSVHIIEPVLKILDPCDSVARFKSNLSGGVGQLETVWRSGVKVDFICSGNLTSQITISIVGEKGKKILSFSDTFSAFKNALSDFVRGVSSKTVQSPYEFNYRVVEIIEKGV